MMMTQAGKQSYLGVRCLSCRQPIPVPSILASRVSAADREDSFPLTEQHDRVFSLRCRSCEREKPYRASDVVEFEGVPRRAALPCSLARRQQPTRRYGPLGQRLTSSFEIPISSAKLFLPSFAQRRALLR